MGIVAVIVLDIILSGDNAVVIAMTANQLPAAQRNAAIGVGMTAALVLRIVLCVFAGAVLALPLFGPVVGAIGGVYLLHVAWGLWRSADVPNKLSGAATWTTAITQIILADLSMSLDNIVAIAGIAGRSVFVMGVGLTVSVISLAFFAKFVSLLMERHPSFNVFGAVAIALVGAKMIITLFT